MRLEAVQGAVLHAHGNHAAARAALWGGWTGRELLIFYDGSAVERQGIVNFFQGVHTAAQQGGCVSLLPGP